MSWEPRPLPDVTPESAPFWRGCAEGRLLLNECRDCGTIYYYPRSVCPECMSGDIEWREASGEGTVYSFSVAQQISGWLEKDLPLVVGYVELEEGPRVLTNVVDCDPADVTIGTPVQVRFEPTEQEDVAVPVFTPQE